MTSAAGRDATLGASRPGPGAGPAEPLLAVEDLNVHFLTSHGTVNAVQGLSFEVARGEIVAIVGESGSGKSVTALSIMRLLPRLTGRARGVVRFDGRDLFKLSDLCRKMSSADILEKLEAVGVPAGPINTLEQVFTDPQVVHRGMKLTLKNDAAQGGTSPGLRTPIRLDKTPMASERPAPRLGEHTAEVLREIGEG